MPILVVVFVALIICPAMATPPSRSEFLRIQTYVDWGPALYYGDCVIRYEAVNTWVLNIWDNGDGTWTIKQELTRNGKAYVCEKVCHNPIDTKNFHVVEVIHGIANFTASLYKVHELQYVKEWNYHWIITSICHYVGQAHDNVFQYDYWVKGTGWIHPCPPYP